MKTNENIEIKQIGTQKLKELKENLKKLQDPRQKGKIVYKIWDIVVVVILAVLSDCNDWEEIGDFAKDKKDFLKTFLKLTGGIPHAITYERVMSILDTTVLNAIFVKFVEDIKHPYNKDFKDIFSFDGKVDKSSGRKESEVSKKIKPLNIQTS